MVYDPRIHHRRSIRLPEYDYTQPGAYFVTVVTHNRLPLFGRVCNGRVILNDFGKCVEFTWQDLINHNQGSQLDEHIIMPNHFHGIIFLTNTNVGAGPRPAQIEQDDNFDGINPSRNPAEYGAGLEPAPTATTVALSEIIRQFKTFSSRRINHLRNSPGLLVWQRNYYEHIVRDEDDLVRIRQYIQENPLHWNEDAENPGGKP